MRLQAADADDVLQDVWLRFIHKSVAEIEQPRACLSRVACNILRDRSRRDSLRTTHLRLIASEGLPRFDSDGLTEQECAFELECTILDLPDIIRDVFVLSRFRRMTNRDIAKHLGISIKTVEWRIGKAIELCADRLRN